MFKDDINYRSYQGVRDGQGMPLGPDEDLVRNDEWKIDSYNLIGASTPSFYYLLSSPAGLLRNRPATFLDPENPTDAEQEALKVYDTRQLQLFSRLMMCPPKQRMLVAQQGQPAWGANGREALDRLDEYYHDHDPGYLADLSYSIHNLTFRDYQNDGSCPRKQ